MEVLVLAGVNVVEANTQVLTVLRVQLGQSEHRVSFFGYRQVQQVVSTGIVHQKFVQASHSGLRDCCGGGAQPDERHSLELHTLCYAPGAVASRFGSETTSPNRWLHQGPPNGTTVCSVHVCIQREPCCCDNIQQAGSCLTWQQHSASPMVFGCSSSSTETTMASTAQHHE